MTIARPPYRADIVGSFLHPDDLKKARQAHADGKIGLADLAEVEDAAILKALRMQEDSGLLAVTDGEFRRSWWHFDFMGMLDGLDIIEREGGGIQFHGVATRADVPVITGPLSFPPDHPMLEHFRFVAAHTSVTPKISIPGPSAIHFRIADSDIAVPEYKHDAEAYFEAITAPYKAAVAAFYAAGCRYLQMDDIFFAYLCDPKIREQRKARGEEPLKIPEFIKRVKEASASLSMDMGMLKRPLNVGFSGGEKKRAEILQMKLLEPKLCVLDETDSGLDIDALKIVADGVNSLRSPDRAFLVITHYQRLLEHIVPDTVHVLYKGQVIKSGDKSLALELEANGYAGVIDEAA